MNRSGKNFKTEVEHLAYDNVVTQASIDVWKHFESALSSLDPQSLQIFKAHLEGKSPSEISELFDVSVSDVDQWVGRIKREVVSNLRKNCRVKQ